MRFRRSRYYGGYGDVRFADDDYTYVSTNLRRLRDALDRANRAIPAAAGQFMVIESKIKRGNYMEAANAMAELIKAVQKVGSELNNEFNSIKSGSLPSVIADLAKR